MRTFIIVDAAHLFYRCRHAAQGDAFTRAGLALHIMFRAIKKVWRKFNGNHVVLCLEGGSWRFASYPNYKAHRRLAKSNLTAHEQEEDQIFAATLESFVKFVTDKTRCTVLHNSDIEGDDFVARWIQRHPKDQHVILSGDSDFVQLLADNVTIFDGMKEHVITTAGVVDENGSKLEFAIKSNSKLRVGKPDADFVAEQEWWKRALFTKIIRGDSGDNIFSAYPKVREPRLREAYQDRRGQGYAWNNFMLQTWLKDGKEVRVLDKFHENEKLIDLTMQPDSIKHLMDAAIDRAGQKELVQNVGIHFLRFCDQNSLLSLSKEANEHSAYLNASYQVSE